MGIVSYYARVNESQLEELQADPDLFWELRENVDFAGADLLYLDKGWVALSWLLSARAREEQKHEVVAVGLRVNGDRVAREAAKAQEAARRGFQLVDTDTMPDEPALIAIQGRGPLDRRFPKIGLHAQTFIPAEVAELSAALDRITEADLRAHFDPKMMEAVDVQGLPWTEEEERDSLEKILIPSFESLRELYRLAALAGQHVIVVIT